MPNQITPKSQKASVAFSLIEVVMALGIVAFSLTALIGLLPIGLSLFKQAMDTSVLSRIVQQVSGDLQQADFDAISQSTPEVLYFDEQGMETTSANAAIYWVKVSIFSDAALPGSAQSSSPDLLRIVVQLAHNPGSKPLQTATDGTWRETDGVRLMKRSLFLARNSP